MQRIVVVARVRVLQWGQPRSTCQSSQESRGASRELIKFDQPPPPFPSLVDTHLMNKENSRSGRSAHVKL